MSGAEVVWDEARDADGTVRAHYRDVLDALGDGAAAARAVQEQLELEQVDHGAGEELHPFVVDPVPRVLTGDEWDLLARGAAQRTLALDRFVADAHGAQEAVEQGVVPRDVVEGSRYLERDLLGVETPVRVGLSGPDVVRAPDGTFVALEDNVRTPTMLAYALAARRGVHRALPDLAPDPAALEHAARAFLLDALDAAAPPHACDPEDLHVVVLADREQSAVRWELDAFGRLLQLPVLELADLKRRGDEVRDRDDRRVDVVFRRTSEERLRTDAGALSPLGERFVEPLKAGTVAVVNAFGTGVADDKRVYPHVEELVRFFLDEEPLLPSVPTLDPRAPGTADRLDELVVKPRSGSGGFGVVVGPLASADERAAARRKLAEDPGDLVVQELVRFSVHPSRVGGSLEPRHVDLRPYISVHGGRAHVLPGAVSRVALTAGDLVVNCSQGGGGKDVWISERC